MKVLNECVQYEDIAQFLANYTYKYLRDASDGQVLIFVDKSQSADERVSVALYKLEIVEPAAAGIGIRRWRFIRVPAEFSKIALKNNPAVKAVNIWSMPFLVLLCNIVQTALGEKCRVPQASQLIWQRC